MGTFYRILLFVSTLTLTAGCGLSVSLWDSSTSRPSSGSSGNSNGGSPAIQEFYKQMGAASGMIIMTGATLDSDNNIYSSGIATAPIGSDPLLGVMDAIIFKYAGDGTLLWRTHVGGPGAIAMITRVFYKNGSVYVTGYAQSGTVFGHAVVGNADLFISKFNASSGAMEWCQWFAGAGTQMVSVEITVDSGENLYVAGYGNSSLDGYTVVGTIGAFVIKMNSAGTKLWSRYLDESSMFLQTAGIGLDGSGNIYVAGMAMGPSLDGHAAIGVVDAFIAKFDASGNKLWTNRTGSASNILGIFDLEVDSAGNSYLVGSTVKDINGQILSGNKDQLIEKYNSAGVRQWTKLFGAPGTDLQINAVHIDSAGRVLVGGGSDLNTTDTSGWNVKRLNASTGAIIDQFSSAAARALIFDFQVTSDGWLKAVGTTKSSLEGQPMTGIADAFVLVKQLN